MKFLKTKKKTLVLFAIIRRLIPENVDEYTANPEKLIAKLADNYKDKFKVKISFSE